MKLKIATVGQYRRILSTRPEYRVEETISRQVTRTTVGGPQTALYWLTSEVTDTQTGELVYRARVPVIEIRTEREYLAGAITGGLFDLPEPKEDPPANERPEQASG